VFANKRTFVRHSRMFAIETLGVVGCGFGLNLATYLQRWLLAALARA
jgi:hypothetical protein